MHARYIYRSTEAQTTTAEMPWEKGGETATRTTEGKTTGETLKKRAAEQLDKYDPVFTIIDPPNATIASEIILFSVGV